jgi:polysaccharide biosynthesis/export protein VpsN
MGVNRGFGAVFGRVAQGRASSLSAWRRAAAAAGAAGLAALVLASGCMSSSIERQRVARWSPEVEQDKAMPRMAPAPVPKGAGNTQPEIPPASTREVLKRGDKLGISLTGIPTGPMDLRVVIDDLGTVTLPHIGRAKIEGMKLSEAARFIEKAYVVGGFFTQINVSIVAEEEPYYVQGEVNRPGKYTKTGELTLTQAIPTAGGYGPFANPRKIKIIRGQEILKFDGIRIANRLDTDPFIIAGDVIEIGKGFWPW